MALTTVLGALGKHNCQVVALCHEAEILVENKYTLKDVGRRGYRAWFNASCGMSLSVVSVCRMVYDQ